MNIIGEYKLRTPLRGRRTPALSDEFRVVLCDLLTRGDRPLVRWLDVGCGRGQLLQEVSRSLSAEQLKRLRFVGYDCSADCLGDCNGVIDTLRLDDSCTRSGQFDRLNGLSTTGPYDIISVVELLSDLHLHFVPHLLLDLLRLCHDSTVLFFSDIRAAKTGAESPGVLPWSEVQMNHFFEAILSVLSIRGAPSMAIPNHDKNAWFLTFRLGTPGVALSHILESLEPTTERKLVRHLFEIFERRRADLNREVQNNVLIYRQRLQEALRTRNPETLARTRSFFTTDASRAANAALEVRTQACTVMAEAFADIFHQYWACESEVSVLLQH